MPKDNKIVIELQDVKRKFVVGNELVQALRGVSFKIYEGFPCPSRKEQCCATAR